MARIERVASIGESTDTLSFLSEVLRKEVEEDIADADGDTIQSADIE